MMTRSGLPLLPHAAIHLCAMLALLSAYHLDAGWLAGCAALHAMLQVGRRPGSRLLQCLPGIRRQLLRRVGNLRQRCLTRGES